MMLKNFGMTLGIVFSSFIIVCAGLFIYFSFYGCGTVLPEETTSTTAMAEATTTTVSEITTTTTTTTVTTTSTTTAETTTSTSGETETTTTTAAGQGTTTSTSAEGATTTPSIVSTTNPSTTTTSTTSTTTTTLGTASISSIAGTANSRELRTTWGAVTGAASYKLHRSTIEGYTPAPGTLISATATSPYNDPALVAGQAYYYRVIASNTGGDAAASAQQSGTPAYVWTAKSAVDTGTIPSSNQRRPMAATTDSSGNIHVAYLSGAEASRALMYTRYASGAWSAPVTIDNDVSDPTDSDKASPSIVEQSGTVHIVYYDGQDGLLSYGSSADPTNQSSWVPASLGLAGGAGQVHSLAIDSGGNLHLAFEIGNTVYYMRKPSGQAWGSSHQLGGALDAYYFTIATDSSNRPRIAVFDGTSLLLAHTTLTNPDSGDDWSTTTVDGTGGGMSFVGFTIDSSNGLHFSYRNGTDGRFQYASLSAVDGTPAVTDIINDVNAGWYTSLSTDSNNKAHIGFILNSSTGGDLRYSTNASGSFLTGANAPTVEGSVTTLNCSPVISGGFLQMLYIDGTNSDLAIRGEATGN